MVSINLILNEFVLIIIPRYYYLQTRVFPTKFR